MEDLIAKFSLSECMIELFHKIFQVNVKIGFRIEDLSFIWCEIIMWVLAEFFKLVNTIEKDLIEL